jgi:acid phosphatase (class A)
MVRRRVFIGFLAVLALGLVVLLGTKAGFSTPTLTSYVNWQESLPPPPRAGSRQDQADMAALRAQRALASPQRKALALQDNRLDVFVNYGSLLGVEATPKTRPNLSVLMDAANVQLDRASTAAKQSFNRARPYVTEPNLPLCPTEPPTNSSYPSGHAAWGRLSALILAQIEPSKAQAIIMRGDDYGESRIICGFHYPSDVMAGRIVGDIVFQALIRDEAFQRLLAASKAEAGN